MRAEVTPMPSTTTPIPPPTWACGKSTPSTGASAPEEMLPAIQMPISTAPSRSTDGEATPGDSGQLTLHAAADSIPNLDQLA